MDVVPAPTIVTQPELSTVATDVSVEYQIPAPSGTLLTNKKLFPTRSKFCTGGSMVSFFAVVVVVAAVVAAVVFSVVGIAVAVTSAVVLFVVVLNIGLVVESGIVVDAGMVADVVVS